MKVKCKYCGGTGVLDDGTTCTKCNSIAPKTSKHKYIPDYMQDLNYMSSLGGANDKVIQDMINRYSESTNYVIKFTNNYTLAEIIIATLLKKFVKEGKEIIPIIPQLQLSALVKSIAYSNDLELNNSIQISNEQIAKAQAIIIVLNTKLNQYEEHDLNKLIGYLNINNRGIIVVTSSDNYVNVDKTNNRKVFIDVE